MSTTSHASGTPPTAGLHHLGLSVPDLDAAHAFFVEALEFETVGEVPEYPARFVSDGTVMLTLWQIPDAEPTPFDRTRNAGLHHFALRVIDGARLDAIHARLVDRPDVAIEFAPEPLGEGPATT